MPAWIWFCLLNGRGFTREISIRGLRFPATLNGVQEQLEEFGFVSRGLLPLPVVKQLWFKNTQNALIWGVTHVIFLPVWLKIVNYTIFQLERIFFFFKGFFFGGGALGEKKFED